jgi:hypothetical protein
LRTSGLGPNKVISTSKEQVTLSPKKNYETFENKKENGTVTLAPSNSNGLPSGNKKQGGHDQDSGDRPCDGERDHVAFAACVGTPGMSSAGGISGEVPTCEEWRSQKTNKPDIDAGASSSGGGTQPVCEGDSAALGWAALDPNLPLWDPVKSVPATQKGVLPQSLPGKDLQQGGSMRK